MKRSSTVGLCLVAVCVAAGALAGVAAAELPEYASCVKVAKGVKGHYANSTCSEASAEGHYELVSGFGRPSFSSHSGKAVVEAAELPEALRCSSTKLSGELTGTKSERNILVTFTGCEGAGAKCSSAGARAGVVATNPLRGELGYLAGKGTTTPTIGVLLTQQETPYAAEFSCEGVLVRVHGPLIAEVGGNINTISAESTYAFRESGGLPQYTSFEGGTFLEDEWRWEFNRGGGFEPEGGDTAGLEMNALVSSEALEIRA